MMGESVAIIAILLCIIVVFVRSGHADYAISIIPILIVPAAHIAGLPLAQLLQKTILVSQLYVARCFIDIIGLAIACLLIVVFSVKIKSTKNKKLYISLCSLYCMALTCVYVYNLLPAPIN